MQVLRVSDLNRQAGLAGPGQSHRPAWPGLPVYGLSKPWRTLYLLWNTLTIYVLR
jgi:hypothetical protein